MVLWRSQADEIDALRGPKCGTFVGKWRPNRPSWRKWTRWLSEWCFATAWRRRSSFFGEPRPLQVAGKRGDRGNWCACFGALGEMMLQNESPVISDRARAA